MEFHKSELGNHVEVTINSGPPKSITFDSDFEVYVLECTKALQRELVYVFPSVDVKCLYAIPTLQHSRLDLVSYGGEIELEKDRLLLRFFNFAKDICNSLITLGHWADYIDPCSGLPMISNSSGKIFNEVDAMVSLLNYRFQNAGCCKILLHPLWGSAVYPASIFSNAPKQLVESLIAAYNFMELE